MITLSLIVLTIAITALYIRNNITKNNRGETELVTTKLITGIAILVLGLLTFFIQPFSLERVDAGNVGIKVSLAGDSRGVGKYEYKTGWVFLNSWTSKLYEFPTFQQTIEYPEQIVITKGGFAATIHPKFNYSLKSGSVGDMFSNLRLSTKEIEQGWLQTAIVGAVNDVTNKWVVDDIFNHREQYEGEIIVEANKRLSKWFTISQMRSNIVPPKALQDAIIQKTQAIQQVQVAENQRLVAIAEGDRKIATSRADSAAKVIDASADAMVIKLKQSELTINYLEYLKIQTWNGVLPTVQSGSGGLMLSLQK